MSIAKSEHAGHLLLNITHLPGVLDRPAIKCSESFSALFQSLHAEPHNSSTEDRVPDLATRLRVIRPCLRWHGELVKLVMLNIAHAKLA